MKIRKDLELAWNILVHSRLRSWLTIIGIVIGIAAVVAIVSISNGAQAQMEASLADFNTDQITITPGYSKASSGGFHPGKGPETTTSSSASEDDPEITDKDVLVVSNLKNVEVVSPKISGSENVVYSSKNMDVNIIGVMPEYWENLFDEEDLLNGRELKKSDIYSAVIGEKISDSFDGIELNRQIIINGKTFRVIGIVTDEKAIYIPLDSAVDVIEDKERDVYDSLTVIVDDADLVKNTTTLIEEKLMLSRGILNEKDRDFSVSNMLAMQSSISETLSALSLFLGAIAAISLLVGGIGIANTMFTSVLEKTKDIGIMKAVGVRNSDILAIFLFNAGLIGMVGGIGGIILGGTSSILIGSMGGITGSSGGGMGKMFSSTMLSWELIVFALFFSIIIGMVAGVIPAFNASKLKPVDALRYE